MINFLDPHEPPTFPKVLGQLSEDKRCLLTGTTDKLTYFPIDTNPSNFLPSNMSCISDDIAKEISYTYYYDMQLNGYIITFDTPPIFKEYNENVLKIIQNKWSLSGDGDSFKSKEHKHLPKLFEYLTKHHVKGIYKISIYYNGKPTEWMDNNQYQGYLLRLLAEEKTKIQNKSKIITPNLGIVKP